MMKMEATNAIVIVNWNTTSVFLIMFPLLLWEKFPFNEIAGLKDDKILEGYIPAIAEIKIIKPRMIKTFVVLKGKL